jgi:hypothetical protein
MIKGNRLFKTCACHSFIIFPVFLSFLFVSKVLLILHTSNGIGKVYPRTGHEVPDRK